MNTLVAAATASTGGGEAAGGGGERKRPEISIEESKNVLFANLVFIDLSCFIYFENWSRFR